MEKADIAERIEKMRKNAKKNQQGGKNIQKKPGEKICPFSLCVGGLPCGGWCQLHRAGKSRYACPLHEIPTISWNTKKNS